MAITVYWACAEDEWVKSEKPEKVSQRFYSRDIKHVDSYTKISINHCPFFNENLVNLYAIKSIYNYSFKIKNNEECFSELYDQKFFDDHVSIRSIEKKFFSFLVKYIFFTEEDSLEMSAYQYPVFEENEIARRCMIIPGGFNIGKYFRNLEFPFILKKEFDEFIVNEEDVLYYLKFHTKEKINFKQFRCNDKLQQMINDSRKANQYSGKIPNIDTFYNKFKGKKYILDEIKKNIVD
jgi:hypothetical protein